MWLSFVCFFCLCFGLCFPFLVDRDDVLCWLLSCPFSCLLSLLFSERVPGLVWFGSVYLVTTAGFVAIQLM